MGDNLNFTVILNTSELGPNADLQWFYFNLVDHFTNVSITGNDVKNYGFSYINKYKTEGAGEYTGWVDFGDDTPLTIQNTTFTVHADQPLNENDILSLSTGGEKGQFYMTIYAQTTSWKDPSGNISTSEWVGDCVVPAVPEPATMVFMGAGLLGMAGLVRKRFKKG